MSFCLAGPRVFWKQPPLGMLGRAGTFNQDGRARISSVRLQRGLSAPCRDEAGTTALNEFRRGARSATLYQSARSQPLDLKISEPLEDRWVCKMPARSRVGP